MGRPHSPPVPTCWAQEAAATCGGLSPHPSAPRRMGGGEGDSAFLQMPGPASQLQDVDWGCGEAQTGRRAR